MVLKFIAGVAVGYIACANYPPRWMNTDYVKTRKCHFFSREERDNEFTTKVINPEFIKNYDAENGLLTIRLPEAIKERFNKFTSKREDFQV